MRPIQIVYKPIEKWPKELTKPRKSSPFHITSVDASLNLLKSELAALKDVTDAVLQVALASNDFRQDGLPKVNARYIHPGVIISFERKKTGYKNGQIVTLSSTPYSFPCDTFNNFPANLRAIALALEALRKINRYGVTQNDEQYRGWTALPPPGQTSVREPMDLTTASLELECVGMIKAYDVLADPDKAQAAYREKVKRLHPDRGGDPVKWHRLQDAWDSVKRHHGL